jgi:RND family efflux transporter MFP subunit
MKWQSVFGFVTALVFAMSMLACNAAKEATQTAHVTAVKAMVIQSSDQVVSHTYTGTLEGERQAVIRAKLSETVQKVHVREGQTVKENDLLISLDKTGPSSQYTQTQALYQNAQKNYEKMDFLFKQGAISETQFDGAKTDFEVKEASFDAVSRLVDITAPISGTITAVPVDNGNQVMVGQVLATVATTARLRLKFGVNPEDLSTFVVGAEVVVSSQSVPDSARGKVVAVASSADLATRTFQVEAMVENAQGLYRPGMFVRVSAVKARLTGVIAIPSSAVVVLDGKPNVFVVQGGVAHKRVVELGTDLDGHIIVTSGLTPGDSLVTLGQSYLDDGFAVNVVQMEEVLR